MRENAYHVPWRHQLKLWRMIPVVLWQVLPPKNGAAEIVTNRNPSQSHKITRHQSSIKPPKPCWGPMPGSAFGRLRRGLFDVCLSKWIAADHEGTESKTAALNQLNSWYVIVCYVRCWRMSYVWIEWCIQFQWGWTWIYLDEVGLIFLLKDLKVEGFCRPSMLLQANYAVAAKDLRVCRPLVNVREKTLANFAKENRPMVQGYKSPWNRAKIIGGISIIHPVWPINCGYNVGITGMIKNEPPIWEWFYTAYGNLWAGLLLLYPHSLVFRHPDG